MSEREPARSSDESNGVTEQGGQGEIQMSTKTFTYVLGRWSTIW